MEEYKDEDHDDRQTTPGYSETDDGSSLDSCKSINEAINKVLKIKLLENHVNSLNGNETQFGAIDQIKDSIEYLRSLHLGKIYFDMTGQEIEILGIFRCAKCGSVLYSKSCTIAFYG